MISFVSSLTKRNQHAKHTIPHIRWNSPYNIITPDAVTTLRHLTLGTLPPDWWISRKIFYDCNEIKSLAYLYLGAYDAHHQAHYIASISSHLRYIRRHQPHRKVCIQDKVLVLCAVVAYYTLYVQICIATYL